MNILKIIKPNSNKNFLLALIISSMTLSVYAQETPLFIKKDIARNAVSNNIGALQEKYGLEFTNRLDKLTQEFIKTKQEELGLVATGVVDPITWLNLIDIPVEWKDNVKDQYVQNWEKVTEKQFLNYEKHKSIKFIVINIPSMQLKAFETIGIPSTYDEFLNDTNEVYTSKVIVGKPYSQTPLKEMNITSLKYNPTWTPTTNMIKRLGSNQKWIKSHNLHIYLDEMEISIDKYNQYLEEGYKPTNFKFVQPSGDGNALGKLKFETDSKNNIYLHDTDSHILFKTNNRIYSAGCIRVDKYIDIASFVSDQPKESIVDKIKTEKMFYEKIPMKVPVYFMYNLMDILNNKILYYPDIYKNNS